MTLGVLSENVGAVTFTSSAAAGDLNHTFINLIVFVVIFLVGFIVDFMLLGLLFTAKKKGPALLSILLAVPQIAFMIWSWDDSDVAKLLGAFGILLIIGAIAKLLVKHQPDQPSA